MHNKAPNFEKFECMINECMINVNLTSILTYEEKSVVLIDVRFFMHIQSGLDILNLLISKPVISRKKRNLPCISIKILMYFP